MVFVLCIVVMVDCATAGRFFPWSVLKDFWRVCFLVVMSCAAGVLTRFGRRGAIEPPNGRVALAVAIGFLVRGTITLWAALTHSLTEFKEKLMAEPVGPIQSQKAGSPSLVTWLKANLTADPAGPMQYWKTVFLFFYLVIAGLVAMYFAYGLWAAEPQPAQLRPTAEPSSPPAERAVDSPPQTKPIDPQPEKSADGPPRIKLIDPQAVTIATGQVSIRVLGDNFTENSRVQFDEVDRPTRYVGVDQLVVRVNSTDFAGPRVVMVMAVDGDRRSNAMTLTVEAAGSISGEWRVFGRLIKIRQEPRLILLVLFTGAFGACMSGLPSLADYLGERKLVESWFTFYLVRPFVGGGIAFIFSLVIRGGFLAGTNADPAAVNPFGLAAVAALVGMFSDKAILKLRDVSSTLLRTDDTRPDKLGQLTITTKPELPDAQVGVAYAQTLAASGGTPPYTWTAVTPLPDWLTVDAAGRLTGTPPAAAAATPYTFQVTDGAGASATAELTLTISPLTITMASPPEAPSRFPVLTDAGNQRWHTPRCWDRGHFASERAKTECGLGACRDIYCSCTSALAPYPSTSSYPRLSRNQYARLLAVRVSTAVNYPSPSRWRPGAPTHAPRRYGCAV